MDLDTISDIRDSFQNITFSNFQKSKAKKELINCIYNSKIENANYWAAELICSGHFLDLWDIIIVYSTRYIHYGNPKLFPYLELRYNQFISILKNGYSNNPIMLRNNLKIRRLFCEIISILSFSNKKHNYNNIKLNKKEDFDLINISKKFKAPNTTYIENIYKNDDPKELFIPINELIFSINDKNIVDCCFWYEWIIEYDNKCKKDKKKCEAESRIYAPNGHQKDIVWIIWDILFYYAENNKTIIVKKIIDSLFVLFKIQYTPACRSKRKYIIYFSFSLLIEYIDFSINICTRIDEINAICDKINIIYREIKKNEVSPKTDYLFNNIKQQNLEKSINKMEIFNSMAGSEMP